MTWLLPPLPPTFAAALRDVQANSPQARVAAAERLATPDEGDLPQALAGLLALARDREPPVRAAALRALKELRDPGALEGLLERLEDSDALVRELAIVAISALDNTRARQVVRRALRSPHPEVRFQAVASLSESDERDPSDARAMAALLQDGDAKVRANTARSLGRLGPEVNAELRKALADADAYVRAEAALALARNGDDAGADALRHALDEPELVVEALDAIGALKLTRLCEPVATIAQSVLKPLALKVAAARALLRMQDARGAASLRDVLRAFRSDGRSYAVQVTGELRVTELAGELARLARRLRGTDPEVLVEALAALLPAPEARAGLTLLARRNDRAGEQARAALEPQR